MKLITFVIPCYNSAAYMSKAIESVLPSGSGAPTSTPATTSTSASTSASSSTEAWADAEDEIEIIIVNDGSQDETQEIAEGYVRKYPNIVRLINQENGGHGEAVNTGLRNATGQYFKVVDSDDWVDEGALGAALAKLRVLAKDELDLMIVNYVYERVSQGKQKSINYLSALPVDRVFGWDEIKHFRVHQYILMHSAIYRTELLRECGLVLPKHTFYVDNIFVYQPLPQVKTLYYLDVDFYRYFIGREDQSVNETVMMGRIDQQIRVTKIIIDAHDVAGIESRKLRQYMTNYVSMMMTVSSVLLIKIDTDESFRKKDELWQYLETQQPALFDEVSNGVFGRILAIEGKPGIAIVNFAYKTAKRIFGFN